MEIFLRKTLPNESANLYKIKLMIAGMDFVFNDMKTEISTLVTLIMAKDQDKVN